MKFRTVLVVAVALAIGLVVYAQANAASAPLYVNTTPVPAVVQATQQYGWPHSRTLAETVDIPQHLQYDYNNTIRVVRPNWRMVRPRCHWRGSRVAPSYCGVRVVNRRGDIVQFGTLDHFKFYEDGSYTYQVR